MHKSAKSWSWSRSNILARRCFGISSYHPLPNNTLLCASSRSVAFIIIIISSSNIIIIVFVFAHLTNVSSLGIVLSMKWLRLFCPCSKKDKHHGFCHFKGRKITRCLILNFISRLVPEITLKDGLKDPWWTIWRENQICVKHGWIFCL